jgi:hypothetical protein
MYVVSSHCIGIGMLFLVNQFDFKSIKINHSNKVKLLYFLFPFRQKPFISCDFSVLVFLVDIVEILKIFLKSCRGLFNGFINEYVMMLKSSHGC